MAARAAEEATVAEAKEEAERTSVAATQIQAHVRGKQGRRDIRTLRQAQAVAAAEALAAEAEAETARMAAEKAATLHEEAQAKAVKEEAEAEASHHQVLIILFM